MDTVLFLQTIVHSDSVMRYTLSHTERGVDFEIRREHILVLLCNPATCVL
jgi:hypothetical protein